MSDKSAIEWTDATWTPIRARNRKTGKVGWYCEHVTPGCVNCYAESFNARLGTGLQFKPGHRDDVELFLDEKMLLAPLRWKRPRMVFVCSMTDLFADFVPDAWIDRIFAVMALAPQHTFQVLTKRVGRMRQWFAADRADSVGLAMLTIVDRIPHGHRQLPWPLSNVWLGVSTEDQRRADERIPHLLSTPAAVRFISAEPLLGPIDFTKVRRSINVLGRGTCPAQRDANGYHSFLVPDGVDWVIVGGESGRSARAMHPQWVRSLRDQCEDAGVPFFFKQWGGWAPSTPEKAWGNPRSGWRALAGHPHVARAEELYPEAGAEFVEFVGKKAAGRMLDGVEHNGMPEARP